MSVNRCHCGRFIHADQTQCEEHEVQLYNMIDMFIVGLMLADIMAHPEEFQEMMRWWGNLK